jgi:hypothetical protein
MAYTFQKIKDAFGNENEQKADIFAPQSQGQVDNAPVGGEVKTSTEGELTPGGGSSSNSASPVTAQQAQAPKAQIINANLGKVQAPKAFGQIESALGEKTSALQDEANQYVENAKGKNFNTDQNVVHQAAAGDTNARNTIAARLAQPSASPIEAFAPKTDTNIEGLNAIKSQEGALGLIAKEAGPQYTAGEKALTRSIMERNPQFAQIRESLARKANDYEQNLANIGAQKTQEAQDLVNKNYQAGTDQLRGYLGDEIMATRHEIDDALAKEKAHRAELLARNTPQPKKFLGRETGEFTAPGRNDFAEGKAAVDLTDLRNAYKNDPTLLNEINNANIQPGSFYSVNPDVTASQITTPEQEARFNNIYALLKQAGIDTPAISRDINGLPTAENFNDTAYKDAVMKIANQKAELIKHPVKTAGNGGISEYGQVNPDEPPLIQMPQTVSGAASIPETPADRGPLMPNQSVNYSGGNAPSLPISGAATIPGIENTGAEASNGDLSNAYDNSQIAIMMGLPPDYFHRNIISAIRS